MAVNNCTCASSPPLLSSKPHHSNPPRFHPHPNFPKFDRCSFPTVSWRQNLGSLSTSDSRLVRASASASDSGSDSESREPMLPPYNVLITGSTKGRSLFFRVFFFFDKYWVAVAASCWVFDMGFYGVCSFQEYYIEFSEFLTAVAFPAPMKLSCLHICLMSYD
ncbi:hypothetical protein PS2_027979 [Malus domestica]